MRHILRRPIILWRPIIAHLLHVRPLEGLQLRGVLARQRLLLLGMLLSIGLKLLGTRALELLGLLGLFPLQRLQLFLMLLIPIPL